MARLLKEASSMEILRSPKPLWSPYAAGFGLGLTLLAAFVIAGQGLGASGAMTRFAAFCSAVVAHDATVNNEYLSKYFSDGASPLSDWLVFEVLGAAVGGLFSAALAGRIVKRIEHGPRTTNAKRLALALAGGVIAGFAARLALGCTSGQALSGGAMLSLGAWIFMLSVFGGGYAFAWFARREWI
jgi:uncharacterized membrane protein YedE/YeeE